jgi:hypothetical protein
MPEMILDYLLFHYALTWRSSIPLSCNINSVTAQKIASSLFGDAMPVLGSVIKQIILNIPYYRWTPPFKLSVPNFN